jgi:ligand-binding sensor domain-containing protein
LAARWQIAVVAAAIVVAPAIASAQPRVHGDHRDVRACLPLDGGGVLAGTGGGLVAIDAGDAPRATWTAVDGLPGTRIDALARLGDDVWIGTDGGVARARIASGRLAVSRSVASRPVSDIARWNRSVYVATLDAGVARVTVSGIVAVAMRGGASGTRARVLALAATRDGLYAGTAAGLYRLVGVRFEPVAGVARSAIHDLLADGDRLWIATADGVVERDARGVRAVVAGVDVRRLAMIDGTLHVATMDGGGVRALDRGRLVATRGAGPSSLVHALATEGGAACAGGPDGLWIDRNNDGDGDGDGRTWRHVALPAALPSNDVSAIAVAGDRVIAGTFDRGIATWRRGRGWKTDHITIDGRINAIAVAPDGRIVVGTAAGLAIVEGKTVRMLGRRDGLPGRSVLAVAALVDGRIVAGTSAGAVVIDRDKIVRAGPRDSGNVWAVAVDGDGALWLGTTTGLHRGPLPRAATKDEDVTGWRRFSLATGHLRDDWVMALALHGTSVWVGSYKGGVVRFDGDRATHVADGWVNPGGLTVDGDRILVATQDGLRAIAGDRTSRIDGLPGRDVTATVRLGDTLWVATRRGIAELAAH